MQGATEAAYLCTDKEALTQTYFYFSLTVQRCIGLPDCGVMLVLWWWFFFLSFCDGPNGGGEWKSHRWAYLVGLSGRDSLFI